MKHQVNTPAVTVAYFWIIRRRDLPFAFVHMGIDKFLLKRKSYTRFVKALGTGKGETFTPSDADLTRWGLVMTLDEDSIAELDNHPVIKSWRKKSVSEFRAVLDPISSHGLWAKVNPFDYSTTPAQGQIAAITRARIVWRKNLLFWRAVPPVTASLHRSKGLIKAIGIGEAPIGLQGTFSLWESAADLREFAYKGREHSEAIEATSRNKWYSEELFARFSVREVRGEISS